MSKRKPKPRPGDVQPQSSSPQHSATQVSTSAAVRETIESVVIAFVLAFLFRTFEAEAFVIPTGSMAPTLMGRHKDAVCPQCGQPFRTSASEEVNQKTNALDGDQVVVGMCPNCRNVVDFREDRPLAPGEEHRYYPSYKGDRILVDKAAYEVNDLERFDVVVFKWPGGAETNFIKRFVGLPNETLRICRGDVQVRSDGAESFAIARKPPHKLEAMLQLVYDNDHQAKALVAADFPQRWQPDQPAPAGSWLPSGDHRSFSADGQAEKTVWLRYRHLVPTSDQWTAARAGKPIPQPVRAELISDFCAYNAFKFLSQDHIDRRPLDELARIPSPLLGLHWVGDLAVECELDVRSSTGLVILELVEGGRLLRTTFDLATGKATLGITGKPDFSPSCVTAVRGPGTYRLRFANADDSLTLWVNGEPVPFEQPTRYEPLDNTVPTLADLAPVAVGSDRASVEVRHLRVLRDLYYIANKYDPSEGSHEYDFMGSGDPYRFHGLTEESRHRFLTEPQLWDAAFASMRSVDFRMEPDQFLALGDNSAQSKDSRLWTSDGCEFYVRRDLILGKAVFVYWPHSWNRVPGTDIPFPLFPNFERMRFVR